MNKHVENIIDKVDELIKNKGWGLKNNKLTKVYGFKNYEEVIQFLNVISEKINEQNHHPLMSINYNKLHIELFTFDSNSLTKKDTELAVSIDKLYLDFSI
tara:strand:- start:809 stop:1108 length:300 start_codon:yes stop_codon:yes gene_type:complete